MSLKNDIHKLLLGIVIAASWSAPRANAAMGSYDDGSISSGEQAVMSYNAVDESYGYANANIEDSNWARTAVINPEYISGGRHALAGFSTASDEIGQYIPTSTSLRCNPNSVDILSEGAGDGLVQKWTAP